MKGLVLENIFMQIEQNQETIKSIANLKAREVGTLIDLLIYFIF